MLGDLCLRLSGRVSFATRLRATISLFAMLVGLQLVGMPTARAQTLPDPTQYCYLYGSWRCFQTLAAAESDLRTYRSSTNPEMAYLTYSYTQIEPNGTTKLWYRIPDQQPAVFGGVGYVGDPNMYFGGPCSPATAPTLGCSSEAAVIALYTAKFDQMNAQEPGTTCDWTNYHMEGNYTEPYSSFEMIRKPDTSPGPSSDIYHGNREFVASSTCGGVTTEQRLPIQKVQRFTCATNFTSHWQVDAVQPERYAEQLFCHVTFIGEPNAVEAASIQTGLRQVRSCPANANPCVPATGDKVRYEEDFTFAGRKFVRSYHSLGQFSSPNMPRGWTHTYSDSLVELTNSGSKSYAYIDGAGNLDTIFTFPTATATVSSPTRQSAWRLYRGSGYVLRNRNGESRRFDAAMRLSSIEDPSNPDRSVTIAYDLLGRVSTVTDVVGRQLQFNYANNTVSSIVLPGGSVATYGLDAAKNLSTATIFGATRTYHYGSPGQLVGITGEDNVRYAEFAYDSQGRVTSSRLTVSGTDVERTTLSYPSATTVSVTTDGKGTRQYQMINDLYRQVWSIADQAGTETTVYSGSAIYQSTDKNGVVTTYNSIDGFLTALISATGTASARETRYTYDGSNRVTRIDRKNGEGGGAQTISSEKIVFDTSGAMSARCLVDAAISAAQSYTCGSSANAPTGVRQTRYTRCTSANVTAGVCPAVGLVLSEDGPRTDVSDVTTYSYYVCSSGFQCGRVQTITNPLGHVTTYTSYNSQGLPLTLTNSSGLAVTLTYDSQQRLISRTAGSEVTQLEYWPTGLLKKITLPDGSYTSYTYDAARRLTDLYDTQGNRIKYTLDAAGNPSLQEVFNDSAVLKRAHSRVYNVLGQLETESDAAGTAAVTTSYDYDSAGNLARIDAPLGRSTLHEVDELNRAAAMTNPKGGLVSFGYDALDRLTWLMDPRNLTTTYAYNGLGDLTQQVSPDTGTTSATVDASGNLLTRTDARGAVATYTYDALNRVKTAAYALGGVTDQTLTYTYDTGTNGQGRLAGIADASHSLAWTYDGLGRVLTARQIAGAVNKVTSYAYTNGNRSSMTTPSGHVITYSYSNGKVTGISVNGTALVSGVLYEPFGPVRQWTWGNGSVSARTYDQDGRITQTNSAVLKTYAYDDASRIIGTTDASNATLNWTYGYDLSDQLTSASTTGTTLGYTYDANGNRLTQTGSGAATFTISSTSNRLSSVTGALTRSYTYDAAGNITGDGTVTYAYNAAGRMAASTKAGATATYAYNGLGQRRQKVGSGTTTNYIYDEAGQLLGEYNFFGQLLQEIVWLGDTPVAVLRPKTGGGVDVFYIHTDHLNQPTKISRPSDNLLRWKRDPSPFGAGVVNQNPDSLGIFVFHLRLPGQYYDTESGLAYNYFRDYDAVTGRYVQSDPIGLRGGLNTYGYAAGNPISYIDPSGLAIWKVIDAFEVGMVAGIGGGYVNYKLQSPCNSQGKRYTITVQAVGPAAGLGLKCRVCWTSPAKVPFGGSFDDHGGEPDPNAFNGPYLAVNAGAQFLGFGSGYGDVLLGRATSGRGFGFSMSPGTIGAEVSGTIGTSTVTDVKTDECECSK